MARCLCLVMKRLYGGYNGSTKTKTFPFPHQDAQGTRRLEHPPNQLLSELR